MQRITLRLPDELHEALVESAQKSNRSLNAQIIVHLQERLKWLAVLEQRSAEVKAGHYVTQKEYDQMLKDE